VGINTRLLPVVTFSLTPPQQVKLSPLFEDTFLLGCEKISLHFFDVFSSEHMKGGRESDR